MRHLNFSKWLCVLGLGLALAGCPTMTSKPRSEEKKKPAATEPAPMEINSAGNFTFPADGAWYRTPLIIGANQVVVMRPSKDSAGLSGQGIRFRVGDVPQMMRAGQAVEITIPGRLMLSAPPEAAGGAKSVTVEIRRVK